METETQRVCPVFGTPSFSASSPLVFSRQKEFLCWVCGPSASDVEDPTATLFSRVCYLDLQRDYVQKKLTSTCDPFAYTLS